VRYKKSFSKHWKVNLIASSAFVEQFLRATKAAVRGTKTVKPVTPLQIDILFALFDLDGTSS
jgi:hypothetical protein